MIMTRLIRLMIASALGLTMAVALTCIAATGIVLGAPLLESHGNGQVLSPTQTIDGTWGPGIITATTDVLISPTVAITIAANTTIRVADGKGFVVLGDLHSEGPVTFTTVSLPAVPGAWKGITYTTGSRGYLNQVVVEYAQHALVLNTTNPITISNGTIRYNRHAPTSGVDAFGAGISIVGGTHLVTNTRVYENILVGSGAGGDALGGGIDIQGAGSRVINSVIYSNVITSTNTFAIGGGIAIRGNGNASLIEGCQVVSNTLYASGVDTNTTYGEGGGIGIPPGSATRAVIRRNWIAGNVNRSVMANGGGIGLSLNATADSIDNNVIYNNLAESPGGDNNYWAEGGGIDTWSQNEVTVTNNLILSNTVRCIFRCYSNTGPAGGGMMANGTSAAHPTRVTNNTVVGNRAEGQTSGGFGGAFGLQSNTIFANNVMANNSCTAGGCGGAFYWWSSISAGYSVLWSNSPDDYRGGVTNLYPTDVFRDPQFLGAGDLVQRYHISPSSPAVDAGTNSGAGLPSKDYDGDSRPGYATWDIGFDEVVPDKAAPFSTIKHAAASSPYVTAGEPLSYTIDVFNNNAITTSSRITDALPLNTSYTSGPTCNMGTCGYDGIGQVITWTGDIAPGGLVILQYAVRVNTPLPNGTAITNTADVAVGSQVTTTNVVTTAIYNPAFTVGKAVPSGVPIVGANFDYQITVNNTDNRGHATNVIVTDTLPANVNYVSGGSLIGSNTVSLTIPNVPPRSSAQVNFTVWTCQLVLTNQYYKVVTSTQGVSSSLGNPLPTILVPPTVAANFTPVSATTGNSAYFTSTSTTNGSPIATWSWAFGDGQIGSGATTSHTYANMGIYTVTLTVTDTCGYTNTKSGPITVKANTTTTVTSSSNPSALGQSVTFTATVGVVPPGSGTPTSNVNFYDGGILLGNGTLAGSGFATLTTSSLIMGGHVITAAYAGDSCYNGSASAVLNQVVTDTPITGLSAVNDSPTTLGQATFFTATATGSNIVYTWDFGDGHTGSGATASNTYAAVGVYTARVTATNGVSQVVATTPVTITDTPITGLGAVNDSPTTLGQATFFTATATGSNIVYTWDFGDGHTGSGATASNTYAAVGVYTARVTATNGTSQVVATTPVTITNLPPVADAGPDQTVRIDMLVILDGSASTDPDGHLRLAANRWHISHPEQQYDQPSNVHYSSHADGLDLQSSRHGCTRPAQHSSRHRGHHGQRSGHRRLERRQR
jgi:uncharacterized repeat protein (TIGR01451 family)